MKPFKTHYGTVVPFPTVNIDTDQILPKEFLKRVERTGYGRYLFYNWRYHEDGSENQAFILNQPSYQAASILVAGANFGCGSSREHAPWALKDFGFLVIISTSFADIFHNNCYKNGILPITLSRDKVSMLMERALKLAPYKLEINLESNTISDYQGFHESFYMDPYHREIIMKGLDDIGITELYEQEITSFEEKRDLSKYVYVSSEQGERLS